MDKEIWTLKNQFNEDETITVGELGRLFGDLPDDFEIFSKAENSYLECGEWGGNISGVVVNLKKRRVCLVRGIE
ncbi:MAG: hypothetical protein DRQ88_11585 [Epsilonproteobacteria bacterium]|nr:MAG: hypothetical protein DRQ88_11585 [Campylobacterota bacterium]